MRVLVTGGAGFIGSHLVERLLAEGHTVVCLDNFDDFYSPDLKRLNLTRVASHPRFRLVEGDILDRPVVEQACADAPDVVIHLAARAGVRTSIVQPDLYARVNVQGTIAVLEACRRQGVEHVVFGSSSSVYGRQDAHPWAEDGTAPRPASPYGWSKLAGEQYCRMFHDLCGVPVTCLRFFTVYGPRQRPDMAIHRFARCMASGEPVPVYGDGQAVRDYTFVDDVVDGILRALAHPGGYRVYNLGSGRPVALCDLIGMLGRAMGVTWTVRWLPPQPGDVPATHAAIERARSELGYEPRTTLEHGLASFVRWFREQGRPWTSA
ncbi:MAG: NAD-dependent epimerase/dehydratase family protein [Armatimonadota bacterium]|nr:NAD-dependent epimerase/dehydratase family protein [Armatimonadota bacterium]